MQKYTYYAILTKISTFDSLKGLDMNRSTLQFLVLSMLSVTLFSIPWLVPCCGWLLLIAWIPLLWVEANISKSKSKGCWNYYALTFLLWNAFTTYWIYKATLWGGVGAVVANAFQMFLIFALFRLVKRKSGDKIGYLFLVTLWIAWEYFYFDTEMSWPWLVLGNGFANTTFLIQWYEYTGVLGGSLWVLISNILIFKIIRGFYLKQKSHVMWKVITIVLVVLPATLSLFRFFTFKEEVHPIEVVVLQPNIDPYNEKFDGMTQEVQDLRLLKLAEEAISPTTRYLFAPETAISDVLENNMMQNTSLERIYHFLASHPQVTFVVGATSRFIYPQSKQEPSETARRGFDYWYDTFNSGFQLSHDMPPFVYHKSKLVPMVEKQPYIKYLKFVNKLAIDLGGSVGSFATQSEATLFPAPWNNHPSGTTLAPLYIGTAICYESAYGAYFASYVRKGAGFMSVITNDGWWGKTPGYLQHLSYSRLRAIETRRSIARSANTGISALINQRGDYLQKSEWWTMGYLRGEININHKLTFYVRYGDFIGKASLYLLVLLLIYWILLRRSNHSKPYSIR